MQNFSTDQTIGQRNIRVVVVDDSALMRKMLSSILESDSDIKVVGAAPDALSARQMIRDLDPDVVTLDVEMPGMDGLTFLEKIMTLRPMPVIMVSSLTQKGAKTTIRALECGAVDFVAKPMASAQEGLHTLKSSLVSKVKAAFSANVMAPKLRQATRAPVSTSTRPGNTKLIAIGASTGGVVAVQTVLASLPRQCPGIVIAQHMPPAFTKSFASRLDQNCALTVVEASDGERIQSGHAYVAPGSHHLEICQSQQGFICRLRDGPLVSGHRPSVDVLFDSVARQVASHAVGVILTGMGRDGAAGLLAMRQAGAATFGQCEASCVVYGMPRAAKELGAVATELPLECIVDGIMSADRSTKGALQMS
ncbi:MAG: chemotaxis response regulator protein-glutamate methylesterase [Rhizobiales bacterium]|nr:chemotaxis response regulator protein-glutamate methylesterase [Hyphomicrobiales bacterium]